MLKKEMALSGSVLSCSRLECRQIWTCNPSLPVVRARRHMVGFWEEAALKLGRVSVGAEEQTTHCLPDAPSPQPREHLG